MEIRRIGVLGAGIMGSGITQVAAQAGFRTSMVDIEDRFLDRGFQVIKKSLGIFINKGKMTQEHVDQILGRISMTTDLRKVAADADVIIEAIPENMELKKQKFEELDQICPAKTILATNTSSLSISTIAAATKRPDKVIGMHFSNPVPVMPAVEIIRGLCTSDETAAVIEDLSKKLGKETYHSKDFPGFLGNRLLPLFINEAFNLLYEGIATAEDIDKSVRLNLRHPMGPLELADFIGLETILSAQDYLHAEIGERYRPSPLLRLLVNAGQYGIKTRMGVFDYTSGEKRPRRF